ncbi:DJ-1/PfpI family protein [Aneurinibacillus tyrosinisolvens]|uniref:DJ-1/PfpI family protein n=1 Tax=Aneurinibacillus tyrosinisolvens TaxID=1443435 RepID=UPI00063F0E8B|nr:DJ-1/PfpI family protein [Aneurinibacillus tyrosinisolvens]
MNKQWSVGMLVFDQVDAFDFVGPSEILSIARYTEEDVQNMILGKEGDKQKPFVVQTVSETGEAVTASNGLRILADYSIENAPHFDILLIPGGFFPVIRKLIANQKLIQWISDQVKSVELMTSVCSGAVALAQAGLLNGKKATTNRKALDFLQQYFPEVMVIRDQKFVDEGNIITSQGPDAGLHFAFHLIKRLMGAEAAQMAADTLEYDGYQKYIRNGEGTIG